MTERFERALQWAAHLHASQYRKTTTVPYVSHLLAVCAIVLEHGGDEDQAIAALLHDASEDQGVTDEEIRGRFGDDVASIVDACTDTRLRPKPAWRARKEAYLARLAGPAGAAGDDAAAVPDRALLVVAADKLHNARSILADLRRTGDDVWSRFRAGRDEQLWYFRSAVAVLRERLPGALVEELADTVADLEAWPDDQLGLLEGLATTRAIRRYTADPVPERDLNRMLFAASRAPSGSNRQPFRFVVLRDGPTAREAKALLGRAFRDGWQMKKRDDRYREGSGVDGNSAKARMARAMDHFVEHFAEVPVVVLPCLVRYRSRNPTEGGSVYPACQNLLLAARALGYGGVLTEWHLLVDSELRELLGVPEEVLIAATIPIGKPAGRHGPVRRRPLAELVFDDRWGQAAGWVADPEGTRFTQAGPRAGGS